MAKRPKEVFTKEQLDAQKWGDLVGIGFSWDVRPAAGQKRPEFTLALLAVMEASTGVPAAAPAPPAPPALFGQPHPAVSGEPQPQPSKGVVSRAMEAMVSADLPVKEPQLGTPMSALGSVAQDHIRAKDPLTATPLFEQPHPSASNEPVAAPSKETFERAFDVMTSADNPNPVGISNAFEDEVPDAKPSMILELTGEQIAICFAAKNSPTGQAVSPGGLTSARFITGQTVQLSIPTGDGGHSRYFVHLPGCMRVTAQPCD